MATSKKTSSAVKRREQSILSTETFVFLLILGGITVVIPALYFSSPGKSPPTTDSPTSPPKPPLSLDSTRNSYTQLLPYIQYVWALALRFIPLSFTLPIYLTRLAYQTIVRALQPAFYILGLIFAPVTIVVRALALTFIVTPYNWLIWLAGVLYPVYVFVGIGLLVGAVVGGGAALIPKVLLWAYAEFKTPRENAEEEEEPIRYVRGKSGSRDRRSEYM
ncbi:hypothetical protein BOTBODRAFT_25878 [Botryobasidium botryosum FD-172 SS1]|uniref:Uncharacterized protein n=1 Tax=Botryobasidium botryosum (strain FD-172 SS1) TaxID=930990 RepID=A0A067N0C1_BOTB1|nr:hypothetical protein BOTBODRAFT_25878 [Botryobasidium botryosum FD-172 SS1]